MQALNELDPSHAAGRGQASLSYKERKAQENEAWNSRSPVDQAMGTAATAQRQAAEVQLRAALRRNFAVQQTFSTAVPCFCSCRQSDSRLSSEDCVMVTSGRVERAAYFGQGSVVREVTVPGYRCTAHDMGSVTVHPFQVGCVPTSPVINTVYLSEGLVRHARWLHLKSGLSVHGKAATFQLFLLLLPAVVLMRGAHGPA